MQLKLIYLLVIALLFIACEKEDEVLKQEEEEPETEEVEQRDCLIKESVEILRGRNGSIGYKYSSTYSFDSQNRLTQLRRIDEIYDDVRLESYQYDSQGRIIEIRAERSNLPGEVYYEVFAYNALGQVVTTHIYQEVDQKPRKEIHRVEYTYASARELKSSQQYISRELFETREYTYANGLMSKVKFINSDSNIWPYEVEISYDNKKSPYAGSPARLATMLDLGYPHQHNISRMSGKYANGIVMGYYTYTMQYTYSQDGYPLAAKQLFPAGVDNYYIHEYTYNYTCMK